MRTSLVAAVPLFMAMLASTSDAQPGAARSGDLSAQQLSNLPLTRASNPGGALVVPHVSGDLVMAAEGILVASPSGPTRWFYSDPQIVDVASSPDGAVFGMAMLPVDHPTSVRVMRFEADGTLSWSRVLHRRRLNGFTDSDITAAPDGDLIVCSTVRERGKVGAVIDRIAASGELRWSRRVASEGMCAVVATDAASNVYWAGSTLVGSAVGKLDPWGQTIWQTSYTSAPLIHEIAVASDGAVTVGGSFDGAHDLLPGPGEYRVTANGYRTFVTHFDASGIARWAWAGGLEHRLAALLLRGSQTLVVESGLMTQLDERGAPVRVETFGVPVLKDSDYPGWPDIAVSGAVLDRSCHVLLVATLPERFDHTSYFLFGVQPYAGPRGPVVLFPGW